MFRFLVFFLSKNSNSFLNHILKVQKLELNTLKALWSLIIGYYNDVVPSIDLSLRYGVYVVDGVSHSQNWTGH